MVTIIIYFILGWVVHGTKIHNHNAHDYCYLIHYICNFNQREATENVPQLQSKSLTDINTYLF